MHDTSRTGVALVDDHELVGIAMQHALEGSDTLDYLGRVATVAELNQLRVSPGVVVLDLRLADGSSPLENIEAIAAQRASIVVYTAGESPYLIRLAARGPISGLVRKGAPLAELVDVLGRCAAGELVFSTEWAAAIAADAGLDAAHLSPRETQVLALLAAGVPTKSVAAQLGIAMPTLEVHLARLRDKYARIGRPAPTRTDLVLRALEDGYLPLPGDPL